jgi:outer membrane receptor protein involved in Fe transport
MKARALLLSLFVVGLLVSPVVLAQSGTVAVLTGQVVDKEGQPMPGVTITAHSEKSAMKPAGTVTDADGRFRIAPLTPSDDYVLTADLPGFAKVEVSPIDLDPGKTTTQNITLVPSTETTEKVTIVAKGDIVDVASTKTATVFNSEFIEGLPIIGRSYQDILTLAPGVTDVDGDGNPNVNGARSTDFQTRVDGVNTTDPASGTFGQNMNLESIAEIEVITTGASAEFSQAQGGFANIITKSGGNDLEGSFKFFFRSDLFDNDGANNQDIFDKNTFGDLDGFQDIRPFLTMGGPFVKDKFWYFFSLQFISVEAPINTLTGTVTQTADGWNNFGKITYQPSPSHRLSLSVNWDPLDLGGLGLGTGVDPESDFDWAQGGTNSTLG